MRANVALVLKNEEGKVATFEWLTEADKDTPIRWVVEINYTSDKDFHEQVFAQIIKMGQTLVQFHGLYWTDKEGYHLCCPKSDFLRYDIKYPLGDFFKIEVESVTPVR